MNNEFQNKVNVLTSESKKYRKNHKMKKLHELLGYSDKENSFLPTNEAVEEISNMYQMCGLVLENNDKSASLFLPNVLEEGQDAGGFGKTALSLRFFKTKIQYNLLP